MNFEIMTSSESTGGCSFGLVSGNASTQPAPLPGLVADPDPGPLPVTDPERAPVYSELFAALSQSQAMEVLENMAEAMNVARRNRKRARRTRAVIDPEPAAEPETDPEPAPEPEIDPEPAAPVPPTSPPPMHIMSQYKHHRYACDCGRRAYYRALMRPY